MTIAWLLMWNVRERMGDLTYYRFRYYAKEKEACPTISKGKKWQRRRSMHGHIKEKDMIINQAVRQHYISIYLHTHNHIHSQTLSNKTSNLFSDTSSNSNSANVELTTPPKGPILPMLW